MRIAWFTPFADVSAIGRFSKHVGERLSQAVDIVVWTDSLEPLLETSLQLVRYADDRSAVGRLGGYDLVVYNVGNSARYHRHILPAAARAPGIVILHDRVLDHLLAELSGERRSWDLYLDSTESQYGVQRREEAAAGLARGDPPWDDDEQLARFPLFATAVAGALGVVVHSRSHARVVREVYGGPLRTLFLPAYRAELPPSPAPPRGKPPVVLLTIGMVNRNKRIHDVIEALGRDAQLARQVRYVVAGPALDLHYRHELDRLITRYGLEERVDIVGQVSEPDRERLLREADALVTLRYPSTEGGSASLMEGIEKAKPVIVYEAGVFAEAPDDAVVKVPPCDTRALADAMVRIVTDPERRTIVGAAARSYAERHTIEAYARGFLSFVEDASARQAKARLVERVATSLGDLGVLPGDSPVARIAELLGPILDENDGR